MSAVQLTLTELQVLFDGQGLEAAEGAHDVESGQDRAFTTTITELSDERVRTHFRFDTAHLRPGGVVAGPILFALCDTLGWMCTVSRLPKGSDAVTVDASIRFLRGAPAGDLIGEAVPLRVGRRMVVSSVTINALDDDGGPLVHAVMTFAPMLRGLDQIRAKAAGPSAAPQ
jgi:uncharacterized protein (TIGR00369 family)